MTNKELRESGFLKTEFGSKMQECIIAWDHWITELGKFAFNVSGREYQRARRAANWCQAQWEVYQLAMRQFYGIEYSFSRTDKCFGIYTEDGEEYLFKINRKKTPSMSWAAKIYSYEMKEDESGSLDVVEYLTGDSLKEIYRKVLASCKRQNCALGAIYKDCRPGEVYADDATKTETLSAYQILKGELGDIIAYRKNKSKSCYVRERINRRHSMWEVYIYSGKVTHHFVECESEKAAEEFCDAYGYTYVDENAFEWSMGYREVYA